MPGQNPGAQGKSRIQQRRPTVLRWKSLMMGLCGGAQVEYQNRSLEEFAFGEFIPIEKAVGQHRL